MSPAQTLVAIVVLAVLTAPASRATTYVVRPDGSGDFRTIQGAINAALPGDVIELTDGVFLGAGNHDLDYLGKAILVESQGEAPEACVIDCQGTQEQAAIGVNFHHGETAGSVLEGVTIRNGYAASDGGAIIVDGASPTIRGCILEDNRATYWGGAMKCTNAAPLIQSCVFRRNHAPQMGGAACAGLHAGPRFEDCDFTANSADIGGAVYCEAWTAASFSSCRFTGNPTGSGSLAWAFASGMTFVDCLIEGNSAHVLLGGGSSGFKMRLIGCTIRANDVSGPQFVSGFGGDSLLVEGCTITDNRLPAASAVWASGCVFRMSSTTIARNQTDPAQAALRIESCVGPGVSRSIIAFNAGPAVSCIGSVPGFECADIFGNAGGDWTGPIAPQYGTNGNLSTDPLFCDPEVGDYQLDAQSPCAPAYNPSCGLIGAWPVGCWGAASVDGPPIALRPAIRIVPSPFVGETIVSCEFRPGSPIVRATLSIYDPAGRRVRTLDGPDRWGLSPRFQWDGTDAAGRALPGGVYQLRLTVGAQTLAGRVIKIR